MPTAPDSTIFTGRLIDTKDMPAFLSPMFSAAITTQSIRGEVSPFTSRPQMAKLDKPDQKNLSHIHYEVLPAIPVQNGGQPLPQRIRRRIIQDPAENRNANPRTKAVPGTGTLGGGLPQSIVAFLSKSQSATATPVPSTSPPPGNYMIHTKVIERPLFSRLAANIPAVSLVPSTSQYSDMHNSVMVHLPPYGNLLSKGTIKSWIQSRPGAVPPRAPLLPKRHFCVQIPRGIAVT